MSWDQVRGFIAEGGTSRSMVVEQWMQRIAANPGKAGESYLMQAMNDVDLGVCCLTKAVLLLAMSPFITYGVGAETVPTDIDLGAVNGGADGQPASLGPWSERTIQLLEDLSARKLTGHAARDAIIAEMQQLDVLSAQLLYRVLVKELRIGCGPKTVNKYHRGLVPVFELKGAKRTKEELHRVDWSNGIWAEYKLDGFRCVVKTDGKTFETFSRNGLPMPNLDYRAADLMMLTRALIAEGILSAGWWAWDGEGKKDGHFNATSSEARKAGKGEDLRYHIFDLVPWGHMAGGTETIEVRHARLDQVQVVINNNSISDMAPAMLRTVERFHLDELADAWELYDQARELGHEGLILKKKGSLYIPGKNADWIKVKPEETLDLPIIGTYPATPGSKYDQAGMIGGILVDYQGKPQKIGSGLSDDQRRNPPTGVAEVMFHEITPDGMLREPRLKAIRADKYPEDGDHA